MSWIPVAEKLPGSEEHPGEMCEMCIVSSREYGVTVGWYNRRKYRAPEIGRWFLLVWKMSESDPLEAVTRLSMIQGDIPDVLEAEKDDVNAWMPYPEEYNGKTFEEIK